MFGMIEREHRINVLVLAFVATMLMANAVALAVGCVMYAVGQPRLLFAVLAAFASVEVLVQVGCAAHRHALAVGERGKRLARINARRARRS